MQQPTNLLFPGYRRQVLGLLYLHPEEALHGREVARRTGLPSGTITRELSRLAQAGLLKRESRGNQVLYSANRASPIFGELASILRKTSGMADVLAQALSTAGGTIAVAFVYGSMARGEHVAGSDIDLMVIGTISLRDLVKRLHPLQATLGREINVKVYRPAEWREHARTGDPFVQEVLAKPKIFVVGSADELEELGGHQPRHGHSIARDDGAASRRRTPPPGRRKKHRD
jgi:predicted nucleotidyltransferase